MATKTGSKPLIAVIVVIALVVVIGVVLFVRGGVAHPANRARVEAEDGYARWSGPFGEEAAARQAALEPVLGEPIGEIWYISCDGIARGGPVPTAQYCDLGVLTTYAVDWSDPHGEIAEMIMVLEGTEATTGDEATAGDGAPWRALPPMEPGGDPRGLVAEAGSNGTAYVFAPGVEQIETGEAFPGPLFLDESITQQTVPDTEPPSGHGHVKIRREVGLSRTNIGCLPSSTLGCGTLLDEASMPRIEGFN
ncbi:hypothetical protein [Brachybacterium sp. FME24]|uniref:hypothetical protein n=1 Tax=Brachybacterium sp. FME24 TaxID=2742605 RepID=UPI001867EB7C|nr:hypothetical protein [Brachybacterium sp. FME24]